MVSWFTHQRRILDDATRARLLTTIARVIAALALIEIPLFAFLLGPELRWVTWVCVYFFLISALVNIAVKAGFISFAGFVYTASFIVDVLVTDANSLVSRPVGVLLVLPIVVIGITTTFDVAAIFAGLIITFLVSLPFVAGISWSPWVIPNVGIIIIVVLLLWRITHLFEQLQESNRQLQDAQTETKRANVELVAANQALEAANQQLRAYMVQAEDLAVEHERVRVAREIHDGLGHHLNNVKVHAAVAQRYFDANRAIALDSLTTTQSEISNAQQELRRAVDALVSDAFSDSLEELLQESVRDCQLAGISASLDIEGTPRPVPKHVTYALCRIGQEALSNIRQHSRAKHASVQIQYQDHCIRLIIEDDGIGIPATTERRRGHGLDNLQQRALLVGGKTAIETRLGQGVRVSVEAPA